MTDQSPEPRDPWAPPEGGAAAPGGSPQQTPGTPGAPSVHDRQTVAGMPGAHWPPPPQASGPASAPGPGPAPAAPPIPGAGYAYPAQSGYGQPGPAAAQPPGYGYPGYPPPAGYPGTPGYPPAASYPGYPGYPGPTGYHAYGPGPSNGFGVAALVLGILSVVGCVTSFLAVALGIAAVVFGVLGRGKANRGEATNGGVALAGTILGAIGIVLGAVILVIAFTGIVSDTFEETPDGGSHSNTQVRERV
ncbi:hypothetical protein BX286_5256 [Streptomyces sp. 3211.6]|uniref:DUF4190 domain-containing protein n=1 Tax=Streptomyces TaxID=1883 RepID=UPI000F199AA0|nr:MULTISPECIES: DUF4190 domain-containing protein [Streptomyces]RKT07201.1 hypothetical protein BX286_5256 [Streptomyces sp. 3211.6]RPF45192.1 hypothetical protein EDD96_1744 [Streptomyces sp. Ag109_G2-6]